MVTDHESASNESKTHPHEKLQRIMQASQDADEAAAQTQPITGPVQSAKSADPANSAEGEIPAYPYNAPTQAIPVEKQNTTSWAAATPPPGGEANAPLPQRVSEVDMGATQVSAAAFSQQPTHRTAVPPVPPGSTGRMPPVPPRKTVSKTTRPQKPAGRTLGCLLRGIIFVLFMIVIVFVAFGSFLVYQYFTIAASLPGINDLKNHASQFETTRIYDRNGNEIYEIIDPNAGRRTYVTLDKISPYLIAATLATEDKDYFSHPGFDIWAIARAMYSNYTTGEVVSGASTITQQLARALLLSPQERNDRTVQRKTREIVLAAEITRKYSKEEILELYLNEIYYGNIAYGIEAASETYFSSPADKLDIGQAAFLAGLPQAPSVYDIFTNRNQTLKRQNDILLLMLQLSKERNCIDIGSNRPKVCINESDIGPAANEAATYNFRPLENKMQYPHWVTYIRSQLEAKYDPQTIYHSGFRVYTTLDPQMQTQAQEIVRKQVDALSGNHATDGALVAIKPSTGEILAMVGSADFYNDDIAGQINMALAPRQPGSSIKPLTYTLAFEKGWTPATVIWDVPSEFPPSGDPNDTRAPYVPNNYDGRFHGPVTVRTALSNSYNIPAVKTLQFVGIYDNPKTGSTGFITFAQKMGITTLTRPDYGLSLTLGGGDVSLLELTSAYSVFANGGVRVPPVSITKIEDYTGQVVYEYKPPAGEQVVRPEHAFLISSILSDNNARSPMFGAHSVLALPFQVAAKTGTTNDFRDNWTLGYTPDLTVGVWVGNADYTPMVDTTGVTGAAPIWSEFMQAAIPMIPGAPTGFTRPSGIVDRLVCSVSGTEPSQWCSNQRTEMFAYDQLPPSKDNDFWKMVKIDTWTGLAASPACSDYTADKMTINISDPWARKWFKDTKEGQDWLQQNGFDPTSLVFPPDRACTSSDPRPTLVFANLSDGQTISASPIDIFLVVNAPNFNDYVLSYGVGEHPSSWKTLVPKNTTPHAQAEKVYNWDLSGIPAGKIVLRLTMHSKDDHSAQKQITLNINIPTPTPTITPTATVTPIPTMTLTPTETNTPTVTVTPTP